MELTEEKNLRRTQEMSTSQLLPDNMTTSRYDNLFTHHKDMPLISIGDTLTVYCGPIVIQCDFLQSKLMPNLFPSLPHKFNIHCKFEIGYCSGWSRGQVTG